LGFSCGHGAHALAQLGPVPLGAGLAFLCAQLLFGRLVRLRLGRPDAGHLLLRLFALEPFQLARVDRATGLVGMTPAGAFVGAMLVVDMLSGFVLAGLVLLCHFG
jgi:hypothetical protein